MISNMVDLLLNIGYTVTNVSAILFGVQKSNAVQWTVLEMQRNSGNVILLDFHWSRRHLRGR